MADCHVRTCVLVAAKELAVRAQIESTSVTLHRFLWTWPEQIHCRLPNRVQGRLGRRCRDARPVRKITATASRSADWMGVVVPGTKHRVEFVYRLANARHDHE